MSKNEAIQRAKETSKRLNDVVIVYYDKNEGFEGYDFATEYHFFFLVDILWCNTSDIVEIIGM